MKSKRNKEELFGRNPQGIVAVFPAEGHSIGEFIDVEIIDATQGTLIGRIKK